MFLGGACACFSFLFFSFFIVFEEERFIKDLKGRGASIIKGVLGWGWVSSGFRVLGVGYRG